MPRFNRMKNLSVSGAAASWPAAASDRFHTAFGFLQISPRFGPLAFPWRRRPPFPKKRGPMSLSCGDIDPPENLPVLPPACTSHNN